MVPALTRYAGCRSDINQQKGAMMFVSFDVDAISGSDCPGISCPSAVGLERGPASVAPAALFRKSQQKELHQ